MSERDTVFSTNAFRFVDIILGIGLALLMIVMRMLLVQATALRSELSEVV